MGARSLDSCIARIPSTVALEFYLSLRHYGINILLIFIHYNLILIKLEKLGERSFEQGNFNFQPEFIFVFLAS